MNPEWNDQMDADLNNASPPPDSSADKVKRGIEPPE